MTDPGTALIPASPTPMLDAWGPTRLRYVPGEVASKRSDKQEAFLRSADLELLYGGAAGGGKSVALLMAALQYVDVPGYNALLLRKTYADLNKPGGLMDVAQEWLRRTDAHWDNQKHTWTFPSRATLSFGYLQTEGDKFNYHGAEYHFIGYDELTEFTETMYLYLFSRVRRGPDRGASADNLTLADVPLRVRGASNPGGPGHDWVAERFIDENLRVAPFLPATLDDNPNVDKAAYELSFAKMGSIDRQRLRYGDWDAVEEGDLFKSGAIWLVEDWERPVAAVRYWDLASTEPTDQNKDPDWTVGTRMELGVDNYMTITDVKRVRLGPGEVKQFVRDVALADGYHVQVYIEQDPGQAGKAQVHEYARALPGVIVKPGLTRGRTKRDRAVPVAAALENRVARLNRYLPNLREVLSELRRFPNGSHDDIVDTLSGGYWALTEGGIQTVTSASGPANPGGARPAAAQGRLPDSIAGQNRARYG